MNKQARIIGVLLLALSTCAAWSGRAQAETGLLPADPTLLMPNNLDATFGNSGRVTTMLGESDDRIAALAVQMDGKLVVAGTIDTLDRDFAVARYTTAGQLDQTFGGDGIVTTDLGGNDQATALVIQPDGKIVVAGATDASGLLDFALARYTPSGALDSSFSGDGALVTDIDGSDNAARALILQPDGKLVVAGDAFSIETFDGDFALARYTPSGALDSSFSGDGTLVTDLGGTLDIAYALARLPDGRIVAGGSDGASFALARYTTGGALDGSFSSDGKLLTNFDEGDDVISALALQADGKLVAAGYASSGGDFALARYTSGGALDQGFNGDGKLLTDFGGRDAAAALLLQPDGLIVTAGVAGGGLSPDFALARYTTSGAPDQSFGGASIVSTDFAGSDQALAVALQADGKLVAAGYTSRNGDDNFALARYLPRGSAPLYMRYLPLTAGKP